MEATMNRFCLMIMCVMGVLLGFLIQTLFLGTEDPPQEPSDKLQNFLTIGILSARENFAQRQNFRETWLNGTSTHTSYKFVVGNLPCDMHPDNRKDLYSCEGLHFSQPSQYIDLQLFSCIQQECDGITEHVWNSSIKVYHPVVVKQLGLHVDIALSSSPVTVMIYDDFREQVVISSRFSVYDQGNIKGHYAYQTVEKVLLPDGFQGSLRIVGDTETGEVLKANTVYGCTTINSECAIDLIPLDSHGYPSNANMSHSIQLANMVLSISEEELFKTRINKHNMLNEKYRNEQNAIGDKLALELEENHDILLVDVIDVYRNLPLKLLKFHEWVHLHTYSKYVMKTDDDCFVNIVSVFANLKEMAKINTRKLWWGNFRHEWFVERSGKWAEDQYRSMEYPAFACGSANVVSNDISSWLAGNARHLHCYQGEDTSMGIWLSAIGPHYKVDERFMCDKKCQDNALVIPELSMDEITFYWKNKQLCDKDIQVCSSNEELEALNVTARGSLKRLKVKIQELERLGKEQDREEDGQNILKNVDNHRQRMTSNVVALRKTNLTVKIAIDQREKEELLTGGVTRRRNINSKETLAKAATNITESLMELNQTMNAQVNKGNLTLNTLETSSKTISDTHEEFKSMGGHIQNAKRLLTKYGQRELTDKLLIFIALVFFFATVLYILKRRIWS